MIRTNKKKHRSQKESKKVYLDVCTLCRPFDDQRGLRIRLETDSYYLIMNAIKNMQYKMMISSVHFIEIASISDIIERTELFAVLNHYGEVIITDMSKVSRRGEELYEAGFGVADAVHAAFAEASSDYFITCDDKLVKKCKKFGVDMKVVTPMEFCTKEVLR